MDGTMHNGAKSVDAPVRHQRGEKGGEAPVRHQRGGKGGETPVRHQRGEKGGEAPVRHQRGEKGGESPLQGQRGGKGGETPVRHQRGEKGGEAPLQGQRSGKGGVSTPRRKRPVNRVGSSKLRPEVSLVPLGSQELSGHRPNGLDEMATALCADIPGFTGTHRDVANVAYRMTIGNAAAGDRHEANESLKSLLKAVSDGLKINSPRLVHKP
jgi:hypothetical protein